MDEDTGAALPQSSKRKFEQLEWRVSALMDEQDNAMGGERAEILSKLGSCAADNSEQAIREFDSLLDQFEKEMAWNKNEFTELDAKQEKAELPTAGHHIYEKLNPAMLDSNITDIDLARAKFQNEETHDLLRRLKDDLQLATQRLESEKFNNSEAWDDLKKDLKRYQEEKAPLLEKITQLDLIKEKLINQWMTDHKSGSPLQLRLAEDALDFIHLLEKNRQLSIKVHDAEIEMRDVAQSYELLGSQKNARIEQMDKINHELLGISGDGGFQLKAAVPSLDLTICDSDDVIFPDVSVTVDWQNSGKTLHRCQKMMDLPRMVNQDVDEDDVNAGMADDVCQAVGVVCADESAMDEEHAGDDGESDGGNKTQLRSLKSTSALNHMDSSCNTHKLCSRAVSSQESATTLKKVPSLPSTGSSHNVNPTLTKLSNSRHRN